MSARRTYDESRAEATPCRGGCGKLLAPPGRAYCRDCQTWQPCGYTLLGQRCTREQGHAGEHVTLHRGVR